MYEDMKNIGYFDHGSAKPHDIPGGSAYGNADRARSQFEAAITKDIEFSGEGMCYSSWTHKDGKGKGGGWGNGAGNAYRKGEG